MATIVEMRQERAHVFEQMKALKEAADKEERDLSGEEDDAWNKMNAEIDSLGLEISKAEREERIKAVRASLENPKQEKTASDPRDVNERFMDEVRALLRGEERGLEIKFHAEEVADVGRDDGEARTLLTTTSGVSPGIIPISFIRRLREFLFEHAAVRQTNATVMVTAGGEPLRVPRASALPTAGIIGEGSSKTESLPTFSSVVLGAYKYANFTQLSEEFLQDEVVNVLDYLARANGMALGDAAGAHYITGNGTSQPEGIVTAIVALGGARVITGAATSGNVTAIAPGELIRIYHSIASGYRARAYWLMNDASLAQVRQIRDASGGAGTGQFMWQPGLTQGAPDSLLGRPVVTDPNMAVMAAGANSIVFGDFSGYFIRDVGGFRFERSDDFAFQNDLVSFRAVLRTDGKLVDGNGLVLWKNAAT